MSESDKKKNYSHFLFESKRTCNKYKTRHSGPENLKNSWNQINKNFFREITFLAVLHFFPVQKLNFGHFWNCKKWNLAKKNNYVKLIYLISRVLLARTFLNFLVYCESESAKKWLWAWGKLKNAFLHFLAYLMIFWTAFSPLHLEKSTNIPKN